MKEPWSRAFKLSLYLASFAALITYISLGIYLSPPPAAKPQQKNSLWLEFLRQVGFATGRRTYPLNICIANLKQLDGAKEQWALENKMPDGSVPQWYDLVGTNKYIKCRPVCPSGGKYKLN